jgi:hypothetical protein
VIKCYKIRTASQKAKVAKIQKKISGVKSGKYTYYIARNSLQDHNLVRSKGKKTQILCKSASQFVVNGKYVYYRTDTDSYLHRMKKNGSGKKRIADTEEGGYIQLIQDGYIYFSYDLDMLARTKVNGKGKIKVFDTDARRWKIINDRIYYIRTIGDDNGITVGSRKTGVYSMALDGADNRVELESDSFDYETKILSVNDTPAIVNGGTVYVKQSSGEYTQMTDETMVPLPSDLYQENYFFTAGNELFAEYYAESDGKYYSSGLQYYHYTDDFTKELVIDIDSCGKRVGGEYFSLKKFGKYYLLNSNYDQSSDGLYIFDKNGKFIRKVSTAKSGEDCPFYYTIKKNTLYVAICNEKPRNNTFYFEYASYKLK